ncbi:MAG: RHS repeat protein [Chloroflexi bacterium]|nr:RHS repeat protein [Chloroflexota bacterium]
MNPRGIRTTYTYDSRHTLTHVRRAVGTADESLTQYVYTAWGGVSQAIDPRGFTTAYAYTARRQVQTITPPAGGPTAFTYNAADDQVTKTDGNGRTWTTEYDASRLVTRRTDPLGYFGMNTTREATASAPTTPRPSSPPSPMTRATA